jgi:hypothetical protein
VRPTQGGLVAFTRRKIAKAEEITMDEPHVGKLARVVLTEGKKIQNLGISITNYYKSQYISDIYIHVLDQFFL